jgi:hypothetical protein
MGMLLEAKSFRAWLSPLLASLRKRFESFTVVVDSMFPEFTVEFRGWNGRKFIYGLALFGTDVDWKSKT